MTASRLICASVGLSLLLHSRVGEAAPPVPPDAGQTLREIQPDVPFKAPAPKGPSPGPLGAGRQPGGGVRVMVKTVRITGSREIPQSELAPLVAYLTGAERSLTELRAAAARITDYYRQHGYAVARAYLPEQDVKDGVVRIDVIEGRIDRRRLENHSRLSDPRANAYLDPVKEGAVVRSAQIDRALLLLNDTPGVGESRAALQPGASVGTSDLVVELTPAALFSGNISIDDHGSRYTGENRLGGALNVNSPLRIGDLLALSVLTSGRDLQYGRIAYQLPIGGNGLRAGAAYFDLHYRLGRDFSTLDAHGTAQSASVFAVYPLIRSLQANLTAAVTWEEKRLRDAIDSTATTTKKRVHLANLGLSGSYRDDIFGGGITGLDASLALGRLDITSPIARAIDDSSVRTRGDYARLLLGANRLQRISAATFFSVAVAGQLASKNLDSSEKFILGGVDGVRAYPQGEGVGDQGYLINLELHRNITGTLQALAFFDAGSVTVSKHPFVAGQPNSRNLAGAGVGLNFTFVGVQVKTALAWRTAGGRPTSIPTSTANSPTVWVKLYCLII